MYISSQADTPEIDEEYEEVCIYMFVNVYIIYICAYTKYIVMERGKVQQYKNYLHISKLVHIYHRIGRRRRRRFSIAETDDNDEEEEIHYHT
jgi:hypothetical protein